MDIKSPSARYSQEVFFRLDYVFEIPFGLVVLPPTIHAVDSFSFGVFSTFYLAVFIWFKLI